MSKLSHFMAPSGLFTRAFEPLRTALDQLAEDAAKQGGFCYWVVRSGKGGPAYPDYPDISLYRHCMDVAVIAAMLFFYAWKDNRIPGLVPDDEAGAEAALRDLFVVAFTHDADKAVGDDSRSPPLEHVNRVFQDLQAQEWSRLTSQECFALVSRVENRGIGNALLAARPSSLVTQKLYELVSIGDKLTSVGSRDGRAAMVVKYNKRLPILAAQYGLPQEPLRLLEFRESPVILHRLQQIFLDELYNQGLFPLICLLDGEWFYVTVPECFDVAAMLSILGEELAYSQPSIKRNHTNGELTLLEAYSTRDLIKAVRSSEERRLLTVHRKNWAAVVDYLRSWIGAIGGLNLLDLSEDGKLVLPCAPKGGSEDAVGPPERYLRALVVAAALRADESSEKVFKERLSRLEQWNNGRIAVLRQTLHGVDVDTLDKNTRQAVFAMQAAMEIHDEEELERVVADVYGPFPEPPPEDQGAQAIVQHLLKQCGLASQNANSEETVYSGTPKGGTCLLCGVPADEPISTEMWLVGVKSSAFNNRMGHRKNIWSQSEKNYICPACVKRQALLHETLSQMGQRPTTAPLLVATPFRGLVKQPAGERSPSAHSPPFPLTSFLAVKQADQAWRQVLPWNLDISESFPLMLEAVDSGFDSMVSTMYRMAVLAANSGNPVHVFVSTQREVKAAFVFESAPALIQRLVKDLSLPSEPGSIRRERLPALIVRLGLFNTVLRTNYGHDMLAALPGYGWWAVAWVYDHLDDNQKNSFAAMVDMARGIYPMNQDIDLEQIALLAANIQKHPDRDASNSERSLALTTALSMWDTGKRKRMGDAETIAAMAEELRKTLMDRRGLDFHFQHARPFSERCEEFAEAVFKFMRKHEGEQALDAGFHRFMLSAYSHLFMKKSWELVKARIQAKAAKDTVDDFDNTQGSLL